MINFPKSTFYNKRFPKQKFYDKIDISPTIKQKFVSDISKIAWAYKLSPDTLNISVGETVKEIEVFEIILNQKDLSRNVLETIDKQISYHLVFILRYENEAQIVLGYKEKNLRQEDKFKVDSYYSTPWQNYEDLSLEINGLNLDTVYENWIRKLIPTELPQHQDIKITIEMQKEIERLTIQIEALEKKIRNEKQFNKQVEMNKELKTLKSNKILLGVK